MTIPVTLSLREKRIAWFVAKLRNKGGCEAGANGGKYGNKKDTLIVHYIGCLGEMACAKGLNRYWSGAGQGFYADDDVGGLQARCTAYQNGCLLLRENDADDKPHFLLIGERGVYDIVGWAFGHEGKQERYRAAPAGRPPAFFCPQQSLRSMADETWCHVF
jgi:hypothetical protein